MRSFLNLAYGEKERNVLDVYAPDEAPARAFLYFHGGGLSAGEKSPYADIAPVMTARGIALFVANYTIYPDAKYPEFIYDAAYAVKASLAFLQSELSCDTLYVGGSSAGGYLSMMLCFDAKYLQSVGLSNNDIAGYLHDAGQPTVHFAVLAEHGEDQRRLIVDERAPLYYVGLAESYPQMQFIVSDNDLIGRYEQTMLLLATLKHFGYTGFDYTVIRGKHCAYVKERDENGTRIIAKIILDFVEQAHTIQ